jgi:signal transduction histidine kinase
MEKILSDMLTLSWLDSGQAVEKPEACDMNRLIQQVIDALKPLAEHKRHLLTFDPTAGLPPVFADPAQIERVLREVISNALYYTPDGGTITVETYTQDGGVAVDVKDNGIGISAEDLPRIFGRFFRADKARGASTGGSGLGLSIARKIVEPTAGTSASRASRAWAAPSTSGCRRASRGETARIPLPEVRCRCRRSPGLGKNGAVTEF